MSAPFRAGAVLVAAGSGRRMGQPKQFLELSGRPVVEWALEAFLGLSEISQIVLVLTEEDRREHGPRLSSQRVKVVSGGDTRMASLRNGFAALDSSVQVVAIHDGARPLVTPELVRKVLEESRISGAAVLAVPAKDTLKEVSGQKLQVIDTPQRSRFWMAQTPQSYLRDILARALSRFPAEADATDESQLVERCGHKVKIVPSSYENIKITTREDLLIASALLAARQGLQHTRTRSGFGYDIHRLVEGRELWLAGIKISHAKGLLGHSDGDVVLHAASDAVLGAMGAGEIGMAFPPSDPRFKGISSREIVAHVLDKLAQRRGEILNLDLTVIAEEPKLQPFYSKLTASLAEAFRLPIERVNFKAKTNEGLGEIGHGQAIACYAVASVTLPW